jgi:predicted transport protein
MVARRRAVSQIIGTLIMLGVVSVAGGVLFIKGLQVLTDFNAEVSATSNIATEKIQEKLLITHVRFHDDDISDPKNATIYLKNIGQVETDIISIKILNRDEQTLDCCDTFTLSTLQIQEPVKITVTLENEWNEDDDYKISIVTARDNSFTKFVRPPNG